MRKDGEKTTCPDYLKILNTVPPQKTNPAGVLKLKMEIQIVVHSLHCLRIHIQKVIFREKIRRFIRNIRTRIYIVGECSIMIGGDFDSIRAPNYTLVQEIFRKESQK